MDNTQPKPVESRSHVETKVRTGSVEHGKDWESSNFRNLDDEAFSRIVKEYCYAKLIDLNSKFNLTISADSAKQELENELWNLIGGESQPDISFEQVGAFSLQIINPHTGEFITL